MLDLEREVVREMAAVQQQEGLVKSKVEPIDGRTVDYVAPSNGMIKIHVRGIVSLIKKKECF